jgi:hypothetical protein
VEFDRVYEDFVQTPSAPSRPAPPAPPGGASSPIWLQGVEQEFEADVYPSKLAAARAAGARLARPIRELLGEAGDSGRVIVFQESLDYEVVAALRDAIRRALPDITCDTQADSRTLRYGNPDELGVTLSYNVQDVSSAPWHELGDAPLASGQLEVSLFGEKGRTRVAVRFVEKPWIENFGAFASERPDRHFIVARSTGTCMSEAEAHQQALNDARVQLAEAIGRDWKEQWGAPKPEIRTQDVLEGDFVVDRFAQSFDGSAGRIWRHALLIDVSGPKLAQLAQQKTTEADSMRMSWARMGLSVVGVLVLIGLIYFFLNAATMGYYEWSLRIAGVVLAIIAIVSVLMIV